jgi:hypothetical protein
MPCILLENNGITPLEYESIERGLRFHAFSPKLDRAVIWHKGKARFVKVDWKPWMVSLAGEGLFENSFNTQFAMARDVPRSAVMFPSSRGMKIQVWDENAESPAWGREFKVRGPTPLRENFAISPDGRYVAIADLFGSLWICDTFIDETFHYAFSSDLSGAKRELLFSNDGKFLLAQSSWSSWLSFRLNVVMSENGR